MPEQRPEASYAAQTRITIGPSQFLTWPSTSTWSGQSHTLDFVTRLVVKP